MADFLTLAETKLHLRVDQTDDDALITIWMNVAEQQVEDYLNRNIYADQAALDAAVAAAPAALAAATATYEAAIDAAAVLEDEVEAAAATRYAEDAYVKAQTESDMVHRGIVVNDTMKAAALLLVGDLYENREAQTDRPLQRNLTFERLLNPFRGMQA